MSDSDARASALPQVRPTARTLVDQARRLTIEEIRSVLGNPEQPVLDKIDRALGPTAQRFIAHSPFVCLATHSAGGADASPRGDGPGFVKVLDDQTLSLPDRSGNALADSFRNLADEPAVGMLFLVPGLRETLRVNGRGFVTDDERLRHQHEADGRIPSLVLVIEVEENYFHCGKALIRSRLWDPTARASAADVVLDSNVFALRNAERSEVATISEELTSALEASYVADL